MATHAPLTESGFATAARKEVAVSPAAQRYLSLDAYRGLIMVLLVSLGFGFNHFRGTNPVLQFIANQMEHSDWEGVTVWDLIQPAFMFMVGAALPFALARRTGQGATLGQNVRYICIPRRTSWNRIPGE